MEKFAKSSLPRAVTKLIPLRAVTKMKPTTSSYMGKIREELSAKSGTLYEQRPGRRSPGQPE